jgi:hypothetical protein
MLRPRLLCLAALACLSLGAGPTSCDPYPLDDTLRLNDLQARATHNSYHVQPPLGRFPEYEYTNSPLDVQLAEEGVRGFELDVYYDETGWRVHHLTVVDQISTCPRLVGCLELMRVWSKLHPLHHPVLVLIEPKGLYVPGRITDGPIPGHWDSLDAEIRSVLGPDLLLTPDDVRGDHATLREALVAEGWPTLRESRGRFLFVLLDEGEDRADYVAGAPNLAGRAMFVLSSEERDDVAVIKVDDPLGGFDRIQSLVRAGFLVRTRADSGIEADYPRLESALTSGAQMISTDAPVPGRFEDADYFADVPGGMPSRCNPLTTDATCAARDVEDPRGLHSLVAPRKVSLCHDGMLTLEVAEGAVPKHLAHGDVLAPCAIAAELGLFELLP